MCKRGAELICTGGKRKAIIHLTKEKKGEENRGHEKEGEGELAVVRSQLPARRRRGGVFFTILEGGDMNSREKGGAIMTIRGKRTRFPEGGGGGGENIYGRKGGHILLSASDFLGGLKQDAPFQKKSDVYQRTKKKSALVGGRRSLFSRALNCMSQRAASILLTKKRGRGECGGGGGGFCIVLILRGGKGGRGGAV